MTPEKIFEIAHRYSDKAYPTPDDPPSLKMAYWEFREKDLIAFTKAIIEAERESSGVDKKLLAYKALVESLEARIASYEKTRLSYQEARDTLESERECNARLTDELAEQESSDDA